MQTKNGVKYGPWPDGAKKFSVEVNEMKDKQRKCPGCKKAAKEDKNIPGYGICMDHMRAYRSLVGSARPKRSYGSNGMYS
jgi:hypothetical protein